MGHWRLIYLHRNLATQLYLSSMTNNLTCGALIYLHRSLATQLYLSSMTNNLTCGAIITQCIYHQAYYHADTLSGVIRYVDSYCLI